MLKKVIIRLILASVVLGGAWRGYTFIRDLPKTQQQIATTRVRRGDVVVRSFTRGELRAARSATLIAPNLFGTVQVTRLAPLGAFARAKDLIVEFDDSEVNSRVEEQQLGLEQIDEQIKKAQADLAVSSNQDQVDLLTAQFDVKRAQLEIQRNPLLSAIDAKKNELALEQAQQHLKQLESDIQSRRQQAKAQLAVLQENRNKSVLELAREKQRLAQVRLLAPISGLVAIRQNRPNFYFPGMQIPDIREGDQLNPGIPVADVLDLSELEILARVGELDRANLREGQEAIIQLDAIPGQRLKGKIKSMSATATANVFSSDPAKKFDVVFSVDMEQLFNVLGVKQEQIRKLMAIAELNKRVRPQPGAPSMALAAAGAPGAPATARTPVATAQKSTPVKPGGAPMTVGPISPMEAAQQFTAEELAKAELPPPPEEDSQFDVLLRPGLLADVEIIVDKVSNAIYLPNQAVFEKDGKLVAYVKNGNAFEARPFKPLKRSESTMIVASGLEPGDIVALADPTASKDDKKKGSKSDNGGAMGALPGK
jgi:multidrug resistance efflux pump